MEEELQLLKKQYQELRTILFNSIRHEAYDDAMHLVDLHEEQLHDLGMSLDRKNNIMCQQSMPALI